MEATHIRIFISSPGDVKDERDALEDLIKNDLQLTLGRQHNLYLEPLRWETLVPPGMGDIQERVFKEMGRYDIFVGIFWKRFGTPTDEHESGSEAEFRDAYARWEENNSRPILMYFCERPFLPDVEDLDQYRKVLAFRDELNNKGLYSTFTESSAFEKMLSRHLFSTIVDLLPPVPLPSKSASSETEASEPAQLVEPGPLDGLPPLPEMDLPASPYRRLQWFRREDAGVFFGRGFETRALYDALTKRWSDPIVLFYGESGVGKSSLLAAGLLPRLESSCEVRYARRNRSLGLLGTLAEVLQDEDVAGAWRRQETDRPLIVILDQVEECYTRPFKEGGELEAFIEQITPLFADRATRPKGRLVLSFRKEWVADIEARLGALPRHKIFLERLGQAGIKEIVSGPGSNARLRSKYRLTVDDALAEMIAANMLEDQRSPVAPTLSILLAKMWEEAHARSEAQPAFTVRLYQELSAKGLLLSDFVDEQLAALHAWNEKLVGSGLVLDVLAYHTTPFGTAETRTRSEVLAQYAHVEGVETLLQKCQDVYLLVSDDHKTRLAHDTLAPLIRQRHRESDRAGQRAERILQSRLPSWKEG
ncbi:MAG: hypothetical protein AB8G77_11055, partial [Rhodothermales bacterium]